VIGAFSNGLIEVVDPWAVEKPARNIAQQFEGHPVPPVVSGKDPFMDGATGRDKLIGFLKTVGSPDKYPHSGVIGCLAGLTCMSLAELRGDSYAAFLNKPHSELCIVAGGRIRGDGCAG